MENETVEGLRTWVQGELRKIGNDMPFDLIVENQIVDDITKPLETVYNKLVTKRVERQIGRTTYHHFRAVYGIQGIYDAVEKAANITGDDTMDACIANSGYLL